MRIKTSLHSDRADMWHVGERAGLTCEEALEEFSRALYSVSFELDVDESTGKATIATVNGMPLASASDLPLEAFVARELAAAKLPSGPYDERADVIEVMTPVVVDLVRRAVDGERRKIGAALRREIDEYDKIHDDNGFACGVESITGTLEEGQEPK
jgi:hypothetical protein